MARKSFTLLELILVVVIVGIIATFAIPGYFGVRQRAEGRQASTQLRLIHTAEKIKFLENDLYVACADTAACNDSVAGLDLDLPDDNWTYKVVCSGACATATDFTATAVKGDCTYTMTRNSANPDGSPDCVYDPW